MCEYQVRAELLSQAREVGITPCLGISSSLRQSGLLLGWVRLTGEMDLKMHGFSTSCSASLSLNSCTSLASASSASRSASSLAGGTTAPSTGPHGESPRGAGVPVRNVVGPGCGCGTGGGATEAGVTAGAESECTGTSARMGSYHPIPKPSA